MATTPNPYAEDLRLAEKNVNDTKNSLDGWKNTLNFRLEEEKQRPNRSAAWGWALDAQLSEARYNVEKYTKQLEVYQKALAVVRQRYDTYESALLGALDQGMTPDQAADAAAQRTILAEKARATRSVVFTIGVVIVLALIAFIIYRKLRKRKS